MEQGLWIVLVACLLGWALMHHDDDLKNGGQK